MAFCAVLTLPLLLVLDAAVLCRHAADQAAALPAALR